MPENVLNEIFKAYDVRGKVGSQLTPAVAESIGFAFGQWLPKAGTVAVGRDMRPDSQELAQALIDGLVAAGRQVLDIGEVTSDMIYFAVGHKQLAGGAMVTASHNPGEYNGIKFCRDKAQAVGIESGLQEIRDAAQQHLGVESNQHKNTGTVEKTNITDNWIQHVLSFIDPQQLKPLRVIVDAGNGMAGKIVPALEPHIPCKVTEMYFELDGSFPNHIANPLEPKNLQDLIAAIQSNGADVGIAFDGDGDRAVLVDETGQPITGTIMTALLAEYFLKKQPGATVLHNAICGRAAVEAITKHGGQALRTKVGHSYIKAEMKKHSAIFGGEHSGHYYFKDNFLADSGLIAAVVALSIISQANQPLSQLVAPLRKGYVQIAETNFTVKDKDTVLQKISAACQDGQQDWLDGLTVNYQDYWFNVRPSNTEPLLRLNAEAKTKAQLDAVVAKITDLITA